MHLGPDNEPEDSASVSSASQSDINIQILNELKNLSGRMTVMAAKVKQVEKPEVHPAADAMAVRSATVSDREDLDSVIQQLRG